MNYRRVYIQNSCVHIIILSYGRKPIFIDNINLLRQAFANAKKYFSFDIIAICVLPDHIHLIIKPKNIEEYPKIITSIKYYFSRRYYVGLESPTYEKQEGPTYENQEDPTYEKQESPTYEKQESPTYEKQEGPTYEKQESPTYENPEDPTYEKQESPTYEKQESPTYEKQESPTYEKQEGPTYENPEDPTYEKQEGPTYENPESPTYNYLKHGYKNKREKGIFQRRYFEHTIVDEAELNVIIDYIHYNPVKHGYVKTVKDWDYSSFKRFVGKGYYNEDWCDFSAIKDLNYD